MSNDFFDDHPLLGSMFDFDRDGSLDFGEGAAMAAAASWVTNEYTRLTEEDEYDWEFSSKDEFSYQAGNKRGFGWQTGNKREFSWQTGKKDEFGWQTGKKDEFGWQTGKKDEFGWGAAVEDELDWEANDGDEFDWYDSPSPKKKCKPEKHDDDFDDYKLESDDDFDALDDDCFNDTNGFFGSMR